MEDLRQEHGLSVSVHILNNWTGDSKRERRVPAEAVPALCAVLGDDALQRLLLSPEMTAALELGEWDMRHLKLAAEARPRRKHGLSEARAHR